MSEINAETPAPKVTTSKIELSEDKSLKELIAATTKMWRKFHLTYDQARYVGKEVRDALSIKRTKTRKNVVIRLSSEEESKLINQAYQDEGQNGLLIKMLFMTGARVAEFVSIKVEDFFFDEMMILIVPYRFNSP